MLSVAKVCQEEEVKGINVGEEKPVLEKSEIGYRDRDL